LIDTNATKGGKPVPRGTIRFTSADKKTFGVGEIDDLGDNNDSTTDQKLTVKPGKNEFKIELDPPAK
jgi:hypothetical protein